MQDTIRVNNATYKNGRYYVHGWKNDRGSYTVITGKRAQFRRGLDTWVSNQTCATYEEAVRAFDLMRSEVDHLILQRDQKRQEKSVSRKLAIMHHKQNVPNPWKVGDVAHTSWGYEQTNVDAYQVVEIKSRTQMVVRPIGGEVEQTGAMQGKFTPVKDQFTGKEITVNAGFSYWPHATGTTNPVSESWAVKGHSLYETKPGQSHHFSSYH